MKTFVTYLVARLALFATCFGVLWVLFGTEASIWLIALLALLFASGLSWLLLRKQGAAAGQVLTTGVAGLQKRFDTARRREDLD